MDRISDKRKCMASLAVFGNLYDQKRDIYSVIAEFIKLAIAENALKSFELQCMVNIIRQDYGFDLPVAVVKRALSKLKFLEKDRTNYTIQIDAQFNADEIRQNTEIEETENRKAIDLLNAYVEKKQGKELSDEEKTELCNEFCAFVIDDTNAPKYGQYISQFIITHTKEPGFLDQLNQIRQGVVIFVGLNYNTDYNIIDKIDSPIHIYLDTELIFHMFGLNGILYQNLFNEFYNLVEEINKRANKQVIKLRYFAENEEEVNSYFRIAERIVRKEEQLDPSRQAMCQIVNGCFDAREVVEKRAELFEMLKAKNILLDSQSNYYDKETNYKYLIDSKPFYENKDEDVSDKDIDRKINLLNYISIKRGFKSQEVFRNVGHILLSANKVTFTIAFDSSVRKANCVPLATNLTFLTNRFWLSLNKGLSHMSTLQSINIITKAQIALSSRINDSVGKLYTQLVEEDKNGTFDAVKKKAALAALHQSTVRPDDINADNAEDYVNILSVHDIDSYVAEKALREQEMVDAKEKMLQQITELHKQQKLMEIDRAANETRQNTYLNKAAEEIQAARNKQELEDYKTQLHKYEENLSSYLSIENRRILKHHSIWAVGYTMIVMALFVLSVISDRCNIGLIWKIISMLVLFVVPFIRPLCKHERIANAYKYILSPSYRYEISRKIEENYLKTNEKPKLKYTTKEEVLEELKR